MVRPLRCSLLARHATEDDCVSPGAGRAAGLGVAQALEFGYGGNIGGSF